MIDELDQQKLNSAAKFLKTPLDTYEIRNGAQVIGSNGEFFVIKVTDKSQFETPNIEKNKELLLNLKHELIMRSSLSHQNIIKQREYCKSDGKFYQIIESTNGGNLKELLVSQGGTLPEHHVRKIVSEIASGLSYLYAS